MLYSNAAHTVILNSTSQSLIIFIFHYLVILLFYCVRFIMCCYCMFLSVNSAFNYCFYSVFIFRVLHILSLCQ